MQENGNEESNEESGGSDRERDSVDDQSTAARYFSRARHLAFEGMLQDPTTQMARTFLLLAFFMFGACRRNTAFMFIGVASKAAVVLGLHVSAQYQHLAPTERDLRLRTGKSIRALDLVCSSILGRPGSTLSLRADDVYASDLAGGRGDAEATPRHRALALSATYEASMVLESIVHQAARDGEHNSSVNMAPATAENFLQMLREWSQALPSALRRGPPREERARGDGGMDEPNRRDREACVGNIHVACTYYFGVILTTRHFLIQHTMPLLRRKPAHQQSGASTPSVASGGGWDGKQGHATTPSSSSAKVSEMAHVCIDAAVYMAQMCAEASDGGILLGNMCILKSVTPPSPSPTLLHATPLFVHNTQATPWTSPHVYVSNPQRTEPGFSPLAWCSASRCFRTRRPARSCANVTRLTGRDGCWHSSAASARRPRSTTRCCPASPMP